LMKSVDGSKMCPELAVSLNERHMPNGFCAFLPPSLRGERTLDEGRWTGGGGGVEFGAMRKRGQTRISVLSAADGLGVIRGRMV